MNKILLSLMIFTVTIVGSLNLHAQSGGNATIKGTITDALSGEVLIGTNIAISGSSLGASSDLNGEFTISNIPAGQQTVVFRYIGYKTVERTDVQLVAGETLQLDMAMNAEAIMGEEVVITIQAKGQRAAINQQLASNAITNIVSSDKIRDVPDVNAAESIGRLPGVSLLRSGGEGNKVVIRGLSPKYSVIEVDGVRMPGSSGDRSVGLSTVSSEMLDGIELSKSLTADKDADAIGGIVNLRTRVADEGFHFNVYGTGTYNNLHNSYNNYKLSGSVGNRFFKNRLGVLASGGIEQVDRSADEFSATYDRIISPTENYVETQRAQLTETKRLRERVNGSFVLDYKTDFMNLKFNNIYSKRKDNIERRRAIYRFEDNNYDFFIMEEFPEESFQLHSLSGEFNIGSTVLDVDASYSRSKSDRYRDRYLHEDREALSTLINPTQLRYAQPADLIRDYYQEELTPERAVVRWNERETEIRDDNTKTLNANWKIPYRLGGVSGFLKTGFRYKKKIRSSDQQTRWTYFHGGIGDGRMDTFEGVYPDYLTETDVGTTHGSGVPAANWKDPDYDFGNFLDGRYNFAYTTSLEDLKRDFNHLYDYADSDTTTLSMRSFHTLRGAETYEDDYETEEQLMAGYVMAEINIGKRIMLLPGIRFENIQTEYSSYFTLTNGFDPEGLNAPPTQVTANRENSHWFPSLNLKINITDWMDVRGAYYKSASRPDFSMLSPALTRTWDDFDDLVSYNPYLKPALAHNYDIGVSFYTNKVGLFTINGFYKEISDLIYRIPEYQPGYVENLVATGAPPALIESLTAPDALYDSVIYDPIATNDDKPINNPNGSSYYGFEVSWQSNFWYLPGVLSGLVLDLNYTMIWSSTELPYMNMVEGIDSSGFWPRTVWLAEYATRESRMLDQPASIFNARIGWDYKGFSTRLSFRYQGSTITRVDPLFSLLDERNQAMFRIDFNARQQITQRLALSLDIANLNNYIDDRIVDPGGQTFPRRSEYYGMNIILGVRYDF
ncbi:MAG: TonB-dependent receptor [Bacteroidetes bacterium]|nr:TonB-dependent receptor [Bacteroidota bacterium]